MTKLSIIVGMGGSGKTRLCNDIADQSTPRAAIFEDATLTNNDQRRAGHQCLGEMVARLLGRSEDCVMNESHLTVHSFRENFRDFCNTFLPSIQTRWIFFQADVLACINNVYHDAQNGRCELSRFQAIHNQLNIYTLPNETEWPNRTVRPVHQGDNPKFDNEAKAVAWLHSEILRLSCS